MAAAATIDRIWRLAMAWFVRRAVALASLCAAVIAGMYFGQTWLLFPEFQ